ncbi:DUF6221 family protein [Streptomyces werraensis]|uniref:DUF6221 family protein n=1 Tax=Streptomyces werraensis TaxID=68284 RepID=UPI0037F39958
MRWLGAQLDEDERIARAACWDEQSDVWTARPPQGTYAQYEQYTVVDYCGDGVVIVRPQNADDDGVGRHVAEHDPARVLREIHAKRLIIEQHERYAAERRRMMGGWDPQSDDSPILAALASVYADRPGYKESWRP